MNDIFVVDFSNIFIVEFTSQGKANVRDCMFTHIYDN